MEKTNAMTKMRVMGTAAQREPPWLEAACAGTRRTPSEFGIEISSRFARLHRYGYRVMLSASFAFAWVRNINEVEPWSSASSLTDEAFFVLFSS